MSASPMDGDDELPVPQLNGDARLQFWREAYLAALPVLLARLPEGNVGTMGVLEMTRHASDAADAATAQHLARNDRDELDLLLQSLIADPKPTGSK